MEIFVQGAASARTSYAVQPRETVLQLKEKISKKTGEGVGSIILTYNKAVLLDEKTLEEYGIQDKCVVHKVVQIVGGELFDFCKSENHTEADVGKYAVTPFIRTGPTTIF
ncbi:unnamed protein product [Echinostoma caproni]|uniref:Ubiquitin-like domain-containing protein n=1 Tax=Echinostoma caproni TaxID=27848 RepID=A0A183AI11_9TREM|nr:unnamed protein product [Echinostoma caproni]